MANKRDRSNDEGLFAGLRVSPHVSGLLLNVQTQPVENTKKLYAVSSTASRQERIDAIPSKMTRQIFFGLTKKQKLLYLTRLLNRLNSQIVKFNVKKLFQMWAVYHREDRVVAGLLDIFFKNPSRSVTRIRREILEKNAKEFKQKKHRDQTCRAVANKCQLLRMFDKRSLRYCLESFETTTGRLVQQLPQILCFEAHNVEELLERCARGTKFPIELLPKQVRGDFAAILGSRLEERGSAFEK
nr:MAG: hypothetical protein [Apis mellifra filamentous-like virus]